MAAAIRTVQLNKRYGHRPALVDLDLEVGQGEVFGYLGPNGAGKSTTIRLLLDLIRPTSGRAELFGLDARERSVEIHRRVGYLPGDITLSERLTGRELLDYLGALRGGVDRRQINQVAERLALDLSRPIRALSKGNRQKVGLAQAFMHRPELLVLDEPTSGLDPVVQREFHQLVLEAKAAGATVFLSSHALAEVEQVADRVAILRAGRLVASGEVEAIKAKALQRLEIRFRDSAPLAAFATLPDVREATSDGAVLRLAVEGSVDTVVKAAARYEVLQITSHEPSLEEIFLEYYSNGEDGRSDPV